MHHVRLSMPRTEVALLSVPPHSCLFAALLARYITASVSASLFECPDVSPTLRLWLSRIYHDYHCVSSRSTLADSPGYSSPLRQLRYASLFAILSTVRIDISFVPHLSHRSPTLLSLHVKLSEFSPVYFVFRNRVYVFIRTCPISSVTQD